MPQTGSRVVTWFVSSFMPGADAVCARFPADVTPPVTGGSRERENSAEDLTLQWLEAPCRQGTQEPDGDTMNIGDVSELSGLTVKTIRYYEEIGLVRPARGANGYRDFDETDLHKLVFVRRARSLGFSVEDCRLLLSLYEDRSRESADVKAIAETHLDAIERKIAELERLRVCLRDLVLHCYGDDRPACPIIDALATPHTQSGSPAREILRVRTGADGRSNKSEIA